MITAIIPARGQSKGIPRKNLAHICGKPLIVWTIEQAKESCCDEIYVLTDDQEITDTCRPLCNVLMRPPETATDDAPTEDVMRWFLTQRQCDILVLLQCTSPIRQPGDIDAVVQLVVEGADSAFSARHVEGYTWRQAERVLSPNYGRRLPRQVSSVHTHEENGSIYALRPSVLDTSGARLGGKIALHEMHPLDSFQVYSPADLLLMETLIPLRLLGVRCAWMTEATA